MTGSEKISIIVPVYKVENDLERCVESIRKQTYQNIEIILVDDGSPDQCPEMCDNYAEVDARIKVIHKENGGLSDARNAGINIATGEYLLYVDSDDYIDANACEKMLNSSMSATADIVVGGAVVHCKEKTDELKHTAFRSGVVYESSDFIEKAIAANEWYSPVWLNMYKTSFVRENNLYFKKGIYFEDTEVQPRLFLNAKKISCMQGTFYHYVIRENSIMTTNNNDKKIKDSLKNLESWKEEIDKIDNKRLQSVMYGMLVRHYLHTCRTFKIQGWNIPGVNFLFAFKYGLGLSGKMKAVLFNFSSGIYFKLADRCH
ncbi:glycosyltransferase [Lachnospiraceae bacterium BSM-380-WT-5A]|uniref:Glycosyltransferase n=1 Tax=Oliverpabstia intestinalis TaxID=2606633 RepID=A0A7X2P3K4_9FIRM|nr:glycosyltransferase [Oliverpabstia intestinalis]MST66806.1 glycosyltransferase [Oliverpabstia intestinalis]